MINQDNLPQLLAQLRFRSQGHTFTKNIADSYLAVDFDKRIRIYPEPQGLIVNERQTCNFSANENFVVFECVHRLLEKGYKPQHPSSLNQNGNSVTVPAAAVPIF